MPRKNSTKKFIINGYYHIYNRGVEKREIFLDNRDYRTFLYFIRQYLAPPESLESDPIKVQNLLKKSLSKEIGLLAYCLIPNHFHFLVQQKTERAITKFMRAVCTNYSMYFNKRYRREGSLFQGIYKAALIDNEDYLLHVSRYIHLNPFDPREKNSNRLAQYPYSSYGNYLAAKNTDWLKPQEILSYFKNVRNKYPGDIFSYQGFVEDYKEDFNSITELLLE